MVWIFHPFAFLFFLYINKFYYLFYCYASNSFIIFLLLYVCALVFVLLLIFLSESFIFILVPVDFISRILVICLLLLFFLLLILSLYEFDVLNVKFNITLNINRIIFSSVFILLAFNCGWSFLRNSHHSPRIF